MRSLFTQSKTEGVEFILINDATPDRSMEIARRVIAEYPELTVRIFEHPENRNNGAARQTGMDAAVGDYTIQIDSDDWCEPKMLEEMYAKAIECDADIVYCYAYSGSVREEYYECIDNIELLKASIYVKATPRKVVNLTLWNKMIRRKLFTDNNIKVDRGLFRRVDWFTVIRLYLFAHRISYLPKTFYHYEIDNASSVSHSQYRSDYSEYRKFIALIEDFMLENNCIQFDNEILQLKVSSKMVWITENRGKRQQEVIGHFPEVDRYVLKESRYHPAVKIPYFLFINGYVRLANLLFGLRDWVNSIRRTKK